MSARTASSLLPFLSSVPASVAFTIGIGLLFLALPGPVAGVLGRAQDLAARLAQRKLLSLLVLFAGVLAVRLLLLPLLGVPVPGIHDEFSYLLMGDTFRHGRLANPPHPMWLFFETFHVNWFPTYSSMYPPAQGLVLAAGSFLGHPWIGVLLAAAAMGAAVQWGLRAWMPARWAFLGGVLLALKLGVASYWINSYWGGAAGAIGGALVLGALGRLFRKARARDALLLGLGVAILANSRPYEGLLFCLPPGIAFCRWLWSTPRRPDAPGRGFEVLLPLALVLAAMLGFMGYYNLRLTGRATLFPYALNIRTYHTATMFVVGTPRPEMRYHNRQFEDFYNGFEREEYTHTWASLECVSKVKTIRLASSFLWWGLLLLVPGLLPALRGRKLRLWWVTLALTLAGIYMVPWSNAHYAAPLAAVLFALLVQAIRCLRTMRFRGRRYGVALSHALVALLVLDTAAHVARRECDPLGWTCQGDASRQAIQRKLENTPGKHLIVVRYDEDHNIHDEWVYNGAEIDGAKVLWARELDPQQNRELFSYFADRQVWLVTPDSDNTYLEPYTPPEQNAGE